MALAARSLDYVDPYDDGISTAQFRFAPNNAQSLCTSHLKYSIQNSVNNIDISLLEKRAAKGDLNSLVDAGAFYITGLAGNIDTEKGYSFLKEAAERGDATAQLAVGMMMIEGKSVSRDVTQAISWLRKSAEQENPAAQLYLSYVYSTEADLHVDAQLSLHWLERAAGNGEAAAQRGLGTYYLHGIGLEVDISQAVDWFEKAAEQKDAEALRSLGCIYLTLTAEGFESRGLDLLHEAALHGSIAAGHNISTYLLELVGQKSFDGDQKRAIEAEAAKWSIWSGEKGHLSAQFNCGLLHHRGIGVSEDIHRAAEWYQKAASGGHAKAQVCIGRLYACGAGVEKDPDKAVEWYSKGAAQGENKAFEGLAELYNDEEHNDDLREKIYNIIVKDVESECYRELALCISSLSEKHGIGIDEGEKARLARDWFRALIDFRLRSLNSLPNGASATAASLDEAVARKDLELPTEIPAEQKYDVWRRVNGRDIVKFLREGWPAPFVEARILTRPALFHLDPSAYKSVDSLRDRKKSLPDDIYLPDRSEVVARSHAQKEKARQVERRAAAERKAQRGLD